MTKAPGFRQVLKAVFGAIVGVQSEQQRQQDFQTTIIWPYLVAGIFAVVVFILLLLLVVTWVVPG